MTFTKAFPRAASYRVWILLGIGLTALFVALSPGRFLSYDVAIRLSVARQLWTRGTPLLPSDTPFQNAVVPVPGGVASFYGVGQSLVLIPFDIATALCRKGLALTEERVEQLQMALISLVYAPLAGLAWWLAVAFLLNELGLARGTAARAAALWALTTTVLIYSAQTAQEESAVGALVAFGLGLWLRALRGHQIARGAFFAGLVAAGALLFRLNAALVCFAFLGALADGFRQHPNHARRCIRFGAAGAAVALSLVAWFSWARWGTPFATGYDRAVVTIGNLWGPIRPRLAIDFLFGGGKGVFILAPALFLALPGLRRAFPQRPGLWIGVLVTFIASCLVTSRVVSNPDGSESWGCRYQMHLLGLLAFPMILGWRDWTRKFDWRKRVATALVGLSLGLQGAAAIAPDPLEYTQADADGQARDRLIDSWSAGQLPRRLENLARLATNRSLAGTDGPRASEIKRLQARYIPHFWPVVYAKRTSSNILHLALCFLGLTNAGVIVFCFRAAFRPRRSRLRRRSLLAQTKNAA